MKEMTKTFTAALLYLIFFSGCSIGDWLKNSWKNQKEIFIIVVAVILIGIIFLIFKLISRKKEDELDLMESELYDTKKDHSIESLQSNAPEIGSSPPPEDLPADGIPADHNITENIAVPEDLKTAPLPQDIKPERTKKLLSISVKSEEIGNFSIPEEGIIIGRDPAVSTAIISDPIVSKSHVKISPQGDSFLVEDLNSTNGTYVDNQKITSIIIAADKTVKIGRKGSILVTFI